MHMCLENYSKAHVLRGWAHNLYGVIIVRLLCKYGARGGGGINLGLVVATGVGLKPLRVKKLVSTRERTHRGIFYCKISNLIILYFRKAGENKIFLITLCLLS